jgi:hypothetical protein
VIRLWLDNVLVPHARSLKAHLSAQDTLTPLLHATFTPNVRAALNDLHHLQEELFRHYKEVPAEHVHQPYTAWEAVHGVSLTQFEALSQRLLPEHLSNESTLHFRHVTQATFVSSLPRMLLLRDGSFSHGCRTPLLLRRPIFKEAVLRLAIVYEANLSTTQVHGVAIPSVKGPRFIVSIEHLQAVCALMVMRRALTGMPQRSSACLAHALPQSQQHGAVFGGREFTATHSSCPVRLHSSQAGREKASACGYQWSTSPSGVPSGHWRNGGVCLERTERACRRKRLLTG